MAVSKKDSNWEELDHKYNIIDRVNEFGYCDISSNDINAINGQDARLLTKFDHYKQNPKIFRDNNLSIITIKNGLYRIGHFELYRNVCKDLDKYWNKPVNHIDKPLFISSIEFDSNKMSESIALNSAYIGGIFKHFLDSDEFVYPTVCGKMSSSEFSYSVNDTRSGFPQSVIRVQNAPIEIDAGYETETCLSLIEAKSHRCDDFLIRQLYYPYRAYDGFTKKVKPIFVMYHDGIFHLLEYEFKIRDSMNSIKLKKYEKYMFSDKIEISHTLLMSLCETTQTEPEPTVTFPQADTIEIIISIGEYLNSNNNVPLSKEDVTDLVRYKDRQTDYYLNAGVYLNLFELCDRQVKLTLVGLDIFGDNNVNSRYIKITKQIFKHEVFKACYKSYINSSGTLTKHDFIPIMKLYPLVITDKLYDRRSSTVLHWIKWIVSRVDDY